MTRQRTLSHAAKVITSGYLRVVEDDDDILNVIASALAKAVEGLEITSGHLAAPFAERPLYVSRYLALARAVVRALLDSPEPARHHHECCPHCTARTGSCVRCGVRDAEGVDGGQLCGPCDGELEAEVAQGRAAVRALREET